MYYGNLTDAAAYHVDRGNAAWDALTSTAQEAALVRASQYIDGRYRWRLMSGRWQSMFRGTKTGGRAQILEWPRTGATDYEGNEIGSTEVPTEVEYATYEAALREAADPGSLSPDYTASAQAIREKVGPVEVQYGEMKATDNTTPNRPVIPLIDEIIAPLVFRPYELPAVSVV
ncbi:DnaT-like ssDNA-binding protein [Panacagrimonas sp.]|uniref:DnaT-like ssDNA-binding protein n=1 Tax=Panacagrimonas sp. TaxID=2480088 RepID=UPI003B52DB27